MFKILHLGLLLQPLPETVSLHLACIILRALTVRNSTSQKLNNESSGRVHITLSFHD